MKPSATKTKTEVEEQELESSKKKRPHPTLLLIEDDEDLRQQMKWALSSNYELREAVDRASAVEIVQNEPVHFAILDLGLPPHANDAIEGLAALEDMLSVNRDLKIIMATGNTDRRHALKAIELGAYDFLEKPVDLEVLKVVLQRADYILRLERENRSLRKQEDQTDFEAIIGTSTPMQKVFEVVRRVAKSDISVLVIGESGTGKELIARALHHQSDRARGPFIAINCGAIPENLLESELFGHEKGAFTGAHARRKGRIESADKGTLFLDEIGELPTALQVKLLRVLQERCIERVGGRESIEIDSRIVAATNIDLEKAMAQGQFREDLYYRLNTVTIPIPPLKDRGGDIILLAERFLQRIADGAGKKFAGFTKEAKISIERYHWPGNVRELENRIKRAVAMADGNRITPEDVQLDSPTVGYSGYTLKNAREAVERELIQRTLEKTGGNITRAASELGVSRPTLHELITRYSLR
ncbi:PEP-CTERM-box response regulator transcription factor [Candidatus Nitronereus thalassa]|uniref:PEP-CTERM-box response regulator transcription factor n=1 Tax=Candidatus Nitronereus thalassa TaxID=3020898 RepID=A0ABU3K6B6_9BACT|nr:PEP-CTERM-box response regulator transcription factor [Candidatus Nitronereus thalassa]MDT7041965.1 PEP-CTERM-box response regulator transcription factor [Candidatus Nitronereus thalassa]